VPSEPPKPLDVRPAEWAIVSRILRSVVPGREVWAFGSRAAGTAKPYSDLDLALIGETPLSLDTLAALREAFSESDLPWKVDLVDWATTNAAFRKVIEAKRVVVQRGG
jgi:predicted nucleotidyltransferase